MRGVTRVELVTINSSGELFTIGFGQNTSGGQVPLLNQLQQPSTGNETLASPQTIAATDDSRDAIQSCNNGVLNTNISGLLTIARGTVFNNATWDRRRSASAANLAAQSGLGAALVTLPGNWTLTSAPGVGVQATATKAAGAAGVRHVLTSINASINASAAQTPLTVVVRDGAAGVGTILWQDRLSAPATPFADSRVSLSGLNIVGSAATAMTVEFTAAGAGTTFETVSATGYDAS